MLRLNRVGVALCALNDVVAYHPTEPWSTIRAITSKTWRWGRFEYHFQCVIVDFNGLSLLLL